MNEHAFHCPCDACQRDLVLSRRGWALMTEEQRVQSIKRATDQMYFWPVKAP